MSRKCWSPIWTQVSDDEFKALIVRCESTGEALRYFGLLNKGGNNRTLRRRIESLGIDCSHFIKSYSIMIEDSKLKKNHYRKLWLLDLTTIEDT